MNQGCANTSPLENRGNKIRRQKHVLGLSETNPNRFRRDVREATKYIETAIVIDKAMVRNFYFAMKFLKKQKIEKITSFVCLQFDKRNGSSRSEVVHDAIQVANIADLVSFQIPFETDILKSFAAENFFSTPSQ